MKYTILVITLFSALNLEAQIDTSKYYNAIIGQPTFINRNSEFGNLPVDIDFSPTTTLEIDTDTVVNGGLKKDTVMVEAICRTQENIMIGGKEILVNMPPVIITRNLERTLEWKTWTEGAPPDENGWSPAISIIKNDWVTTETRWLDPVEGCYQLLPLKE